MLWYTISEKNIVWQCYWTQLCLVPLFAQPHRTSPCLTMGMKWVHRLPHMLRDVHKMPAQHKCTWEHHTIFAFLLNPRDWSNEECLLTPQPSFLQENNANNVCIFSAIFFIFPTVLSQSVNTDHLITLHCVIVLPYECPSQSSSCLCCLKRPRLTLFTLHTVP